MITVHCHHQGCANEMDRIVVISTAGNQLAETHDCCGQH